MPSAAILAGGQARRFGGRDKSALQVGGQSILSRQIDTLTALCDDVSIVGRTEAIGHPGLRGVPDRVPGRGPLGGLDSALAAARHDTLLIVACDMPFLDRRFLEYLLSLTKQADAVVPRIALSVQPLCAVYNRACHATVREQLDGERLAMTDLLGRLSVRYVEEWEIRVFGKPDTILANVNTPSALDDLAAVMGHKF